MLLFYNEVKNEVCKNEMMMIMVGKYRCVILLFKVGFDDNE